VLQQRGVVASLSQEKADLLKVSPALFLIRIQRLLVALGLVPSEQRLLVALFLLFNSDIG
jgi:hypothetical protein